MRTTPNAAESFDDYDVTNNTPRDTVPPRPEHAFVNGDTLTLTYNEALRNSVPAHERVHGERERRAMCRTGSASVRVGTVSVVLTLSEAVESGDVVTLDYDESTSNPVMDLTRNPAGEPHQLCRGEQHALRRRERRRREHARVHLAHGRVEGAGILA